MAETVAFQFEQIIAKDEPQNLSNKIFQSAEKAFITCEGDCRYRYDGENPTDKIGHLLRDGSYILLTGICQIQSFKFVKTGYGDSTLSISYERI